MASAFDGLNEVDAESVRRSLWAGETMASIRREFTDIEGNCSISAQRMRDMRDELFEPLLSDPDKVKALAAGPCINPLVLNRPKPIVERAARMARAASKPVQIEMFPA